VWVPVTVLLLVLAVAGAAGLRSLWGRAAVGVALAAGGGLALALWGAVAPASLAWLVAEVPAAGLLRDGQRFVVLWWLPCCVAIGLGTTRLAGRLPAGAARAAVTAGVIALPLVALPDLALGLLGRLAPVAYPRDWDDVRAAVAAAPEQGDVSSVPFQPYRRVGWNEDRPQLDPAPRYLPVTVVVSRDLTVATGAGLVVVPGDDARAARVGQALAAADLPALRRAGIGWILVDTQTPGEVPAGLVDAGAVAVRGPDLTLIRLDPAAAPGPAGWAAAVVVADATAAATVLVAGVTGGLRRRRAAMVRSA
jgi:hypothetical protein